MPTDLVQNDTTSILSAIAAEDQESLSELLATEYLTDLPRQFSPHFESWRERRASELAAMIIASLTQKLDELERDGHWDRCLAFCDSFRRTGFSFDVEVRRVRAIVFLRGLSSGRLEYERLITRAEAEGFPASDLDDLKPLLSRPTAQDLEGTEIEGLPFVGRASEHRDLHHLFRAVNAGTSQICGIFGVPGIGKTRLAERAVRKMVLAGARVLSGRCTRSKRFSPFSALRSLLKSGLHESDLNHIERPWREAISVLVLRPGEPEDPAALPDLSLADNRLRMLEAVTALVTNMARQVPTALFLDDIQWIDSSTNDWITYLVDTEPSHRIFFLYTSRSARDASKGHSIEGTWPESSIWLDELEPEQIRQAIATYLRRSTTDLSDQLLKELSVTCGNPFTLKTVLTALRNNGNLDENVPERISLRVRLENLAPMDMQILSLLSVASAPLREEEFACLAPPLVASRSLASLIAEGFAQIDEGRAYLAHDIIRDELEHIVPRSRLRLLHHTAGIILARRGADFGSVAWHFQAAGDQLAAHKYAVAAAHESKALAAYPESIDQLRLAADTAPTLSAELFAEFELAELLHELKRDAEAEVLLNRIQKNLDIAENTSIPAQMVRVYLAEIACERPTCQNPTVLLRALYDDLDKRDEPLAQVRVLARLAAAFQLSGDAAQMRDLINPLEALVNRHPDTTPALEAGYLAGTIILHSQSRRIGLTRARTEIRKTAALPLLRLKTLRLLGAAYLHNGLLPAASSTLKQAAELAEEIGASILLAKVLSDAAVVEVEQKAFGQAEELLLRSIDISESAEHARLLNSVAKLNLVIAYYEWGRLSDAADIGRNLLREFTEDLVATSAHALLALVALERRDFRLARTHVDCLHPESRMETRHAGDLSYLVLPTSRVAQQDGRVDYALQHIHGHLARAIRLDLFSGMRLLLEKARLLRQVNEAVAVQIAGRVHRRAKTLKATLVEEQAGRLLLELGG